MSIRHALALAAVTALGISAAACSSSSSSSPSASVSDQVDAQVAKAVGLSTGEVATACPDDAEAREGSTFDCHITVEDQSLTATVTFTSSTKFTYDIHGKVFDTAELIAGLKTDLAKGLGAEVTELHCPGAQHTVIATDETITCTGTDATGASGKAIIGLDADGKAVVEKLTN
jgi:hypothetical protein